METLKTLRVLVVEDELLLALCMEEQLQEDGHTVIGPAANAAQALELIEMEDLDAAVLDVNLSGERSTTVAEALRARNIPFVVTTGYSGLQLDEPVWQDAPQLSKPFRSEQLARMLARTTGVHGG
jgi:CheY-like chemotaxis protein